MQGFNMGRYVPPESEGLTSGNALHKKHALGTRASKLKSEGILTVRFEMPFAVWCDGCKPHPQIIGQGVRFNAEKKKAGNYYSSPVYSFRMKHGACGGWIEIRTDPKNTAYVVVSGGRRRDTGEDKDQDSLVGAQPIVTAREQVEQRETAFANLEKTIEDRAAFEAAKERIGEIEETNARRWDDPYSKNQALRRVFRVGRKAREEGAKVAEDLKERMSLGIELLPESEEDARWARLVDFGSSASTKDAGRDGAEEKVLAKPLFGDVKAGTEEKNANGNSKTSRRLKSEVAASKTRKSLVSEIVGNTRMGSDPFLEPRPRSKDSTKISAPNFLPRLKRKRDSAEKPSLVTDEKPPEKIAAVSSILVDYDSD